MPSGSCTAQRSSWPSTLRKTCATPAGCSVGSSSSKKSGPICAMERAWPFTCNAITTLAECPFWFCMAMTDEIFSQRARAYADRHDIVPGRRLGLGTHGAVFAAESKLKPLRSAIKIYKERDPYDRELSVYERLAEQAVSEIEG